MSIFQVLCHETDKVVQKAGILNALSSDAREKVARMLSDTNTTSDIVRNPAGGIAYIVYQNACGKILLRPTGIDRIDEFGTTWAMTPSDTTKTPQ